MCPPKDPQLFSPPKKPEHWQTATQLEVNYVGGALKITHYLKRLRDILVADVSRQLNCTLDEAFSIVDDHLVGIRKPARNRNTLAASPDAVRLLEEDVLTRKDESAPPKPVTWYSSTDLSRTHQGNPRTLARKLHHLRDDLIHDLSEAGYVDSEKLVDAHLIGMRKPSSGQETIAASPDTVRLAEEMSVIIPRVRNR